MNHFNTPINSSKMTKKHTILFSLFLSGFVQVFFIAVNTYFLAKEMYLGVVVSSFMISLIWSFNVKKIAFGSTAHRITYALGATFGSVFGLWSSAFIASLLEVITG